MCNNFSMSKFLIKHPFFIAIILIVYIFFSQLKKHNIFPSSGTKATSCKSAIVMLKKRSPKSWKIRCKKNHLIVEVPTKLKKKEAIYREMANNLTFISKNCLNESLERTNSVLLVMKNKSTHIKSLIAGKYIAKMASLKETSKIINFIQNYVTVDETPIR